MAVEVVARPGMCEVRVESGTGRVDMIKRGGQNVQLFIESDLRKLVDPVTGWADPNDERVAEPLKRLAEKDHVRYVIETHRRPSAPDKPLGQLGNREKLREVVALEILDGASESSAAHGPERRDDGTGRSAPQQQGRPVPVATDAGRTGPAQADERPSFGPGPDNAGFPATLLSIAAALVKSAGACVPDHPRAGDLAKAHSSLRRWAAEIAGVDTGPAERADARRRAS